MAQRPARRGLRRDSRHGHRRRRCRRRPRDHRRQRDRRRMGAQPAAVAGRRRAAGARLLLRPARVHRDVPVRSRPLPPTTARRGGGADRAARTSSRELRAETTRWRGDRSTRGSGGWRNRSRPSSTSSIPTSSSSAAGCRASGGSTIVCRSCGRAGCSPIAWTRDSSRRAMATRAASGARRGCGRKMPHWI